MKPFGMMPPREPIVGDDGRPTHNWWRWFNNMFAITGSGQATATLVDVISSQYLPSSPSGPDYSRQIADLQTMIAAIPRTVSTQDFQQVTTDLASLYNWVASISNTAGAVAELDGKVRGLQTYVASLRPGSGGSSSGGSSSGAIYAPLVNGDLPGPTLVANGAGECIMVRIV